MMGSAIGLLYSLAQDSRNTDKYGFWDGQAATNLQNGGRDPSIAGVPGVQIGFNVEREEIGGHIYTIAQSFETKKGSLKESVMLLKRIVRQRRSSKGSKKDELMRVLEAAREQGASRQKAIKDHLNEVRANRDSLANRINELKAEIEKKKRSSPGVDSPPEPPPSPPSGTESSIELVRQLASLRDAGVLSEKEFEEKKKQILDQI